MEISRHWRLNEQRYRLQGSTCTHCGKAFFGPRVVCDECQPSMTALTEMVMVSREELEAAYIANK